MDKITETKITEIFECKNAKATVTTIDGKIKHVSVHAKVEENIEKLKWKWLFTLKRGTHFSTDRELYDFLGDLCDVIDAPMSLLTDSGLSD